MTRVAIYARISVSLEESVSLSRQIEACRRYAEARGWTVVAEFIDDGVSATHNKPENRIAWRSLLDTRAGFDRVIVWKVDRLARRVIDFLQADEALQARGAALVAVEDPIDMSTPQGRAFATMLAVFGEMEAASISARVAAARSHLIRSGRVVGGTVPYGYMSVENPDGPGLVLAQDPERIGWVRGMAERVLAGHTVYAVQQWLNTENAPLPLASQVNRKRDGWHYSTVERLLRHPVLAGMTPFNPGNPEKARGGDVLRDKNGLPVVDEALAVLTTEDRRTLITMLDGRDTPQARPRASKGSTSPLLSRLVTCGHCDRIMARGTTQGRPSLSCERCHQVISRTQLDAHIINRLLAERGSSWVNTATDETPDNRAELTNIEEAIRDVTEKLAQDNADTAVLINQLDSLKELRTKARAGAGKRHVRIHVVGRTVTADWEAAQDDLARRDVLAAQVESIRIVRGKIGRYLDPDRVEIQWRTEDELD